jgi:hypothetical protein
LHYALDPSGNNLPSGLPDDVRRRRERPLQALPALVGKAGPSKAMTRLTKLRLGAFGGCLAPLFRLAGCKAGGRGYVESEREWL